MKKLFVVLSILAVALVWWLYQRSSAAPEIPFTKVKRETLVSTLVTNGKAEPLEWVAVRTEQGGLVEKVRVQDGQPVAKGAVLIEMNSAAAREEFAAAEAKVTQARAELSVLDRGGRASEIADIESSLKRARLDAEAARVDVGALQRLVQKKAATQQELQEATRRLERAQAEVQSLDRKRAVLVTDADLAAARARLREAQSSVALTRQKLNNSSVRSPISGVVYNTEARVGSVLNPGDLITKVGQIEKIRVMVYVDEPELGRVALGLPVTITWDALAGRKWTGTVERMPAEIVALGTRQVGEVVCVIDNPKRDLLPGTNIDAEIRSRVVENALTVPREALRRKAGQAGVFVLQSDSVAWRNVTLGASSITRTQILNGLGEGEAVALPSSTPIQEGMSVRPQFR
ncbi:MAG: efflux RND transporter periplasmic adaptor subunit [Bryobacteraceae bacterium]